MRRAFRLIETANGQGSNCTEQVAPEEEMSEKDYPEGWDQDRIRRAARHYENQSDGEAVAEDDGVHASITRCTMRVPGDLVEEVRKLIAKKPTA